MFVTIFTIIITLATLLITQLQHISIQFLFYHIVLSGRGRYPTPTERFSAVWIFAEFLRMINKGLCTKRVNRVHRMFDIKRQGQQRAAAFLSNGANYL